MTQKQIQTTLLDRLESVDLRGTLLFAKAKSSKNFCKVSHFVRIYCFGYFATLRFAQYDGVGRGFAQYDKWFGLPRFSNAESRNDGNGVGVVE